MTLRKTCVPLLPWPLIAAWLVSVVPGAEPEFRRLPVETYRDKMKAGWIGQIIGVSWGAPTEGKYRQIVVRAGGRIERDANDGEMSLIPRQAPIPSKFEDLKAPGPIAGSVYSDEEKARIQPPTQR